MTSFVTPKKNAVTQVLVETYVAIIPGDSLWFGPHGPFYVINVFKHQMRDDRAPYPPHLSVTIQNRYTAPNTILTVGIEFMKEIPL